MATTHEKRVRAIAQKEWKVELMADWMMGRRASQSSLLSSSKWCSIVRIDLFKHSVTPLACGQNVKNSPASHSAAVRDRLKLDLQTQYRYPSLNIVERRGCNKLHHEMLSWDQKQLLMEQLPTRSTNIVHENQDLFVANKLVIPDKKSNETFCQGKAGMSNFCGLSLEWPLYKGHVLYDLTCSLPSLLTAENKISYGSTALPFECHNSRDSWAYLNLRGTKLFGTIRTCRTMLLRPWIWLGSPN